MNTQQLQARSDLLISASCWCVTCIQPQHIDSTIITTCKAQNQIELEPHFCCQNTRAPTTRNNAALLADRYIDLGAPLVLVGKASGVAAAAATAPRVFAVEVLPTVRSTPSSCLQAPRNSTGVDDGKWSEFSPDRKEKTKALGCIP